MPAQDAPYPQGNQLTEREYFGILTNELRTPLTTIAGYTDILLRNLLDPLTAKQQEVIDILHKRSTYALYILDLGLVTIELQEHTLKLRQDFYNLSDIIAQSLQHSLYHNVTISEVVHVVLKSHQSTVWVDKRLIVILLTETLNLIFASIREERLDIEVYMDNILQIRFVFADKEGFVMRSYQALLQVEQNSAPFIRIIPILIAFFQGAMSLEHNQEGQQQIIIQIPTELPSGAVREPSC